MARHQRLAGRLIWLAIDIDTARVFAWSSIRAKCNPIADCNRTTTGYQSAIVSLARTLEYVIGNSISIAATIIIIIIISIGNHEMSRTRNFATIASSA